MTASSPLLHVCEQVWGRIRPRATTVHVTLTGSKLFSDRSALTKSEELRKLVEALRERGLPADAVALEGATLDVSTGLFTRSSSVTYRVSVRVADLERLPAVLEVISESKQATLSYLEWDYASGASEELISDCAKRAVAKAQQLAAALGIALGELLEIHEEELGEHAPQSFAVDCAYPMAARGRGGDGVMAGMSRQLAGLDLAPPRQVGVRVRLAYRVSGGEADGVVRGRST